MNNRVQINLFLTLLLILQSCGFQVNCPDFDAETLEWIPYQNNDIIILENSSKESHITLAVNSIYVEHTTHYVTNQKCGTCDDIISINGNETDNNNFLVHIGLNKNRINSQDYLVNGTYFTDYNSEYSEHNNYLFDGDVYEAVRIFEKSVANETYRKLIIAKGYGIVGLVDYEGNAWKLVDVISSSGGISNNIDIKKVSCE